MVQAVGLWPSELTKEEECQKGVGSSDASDVAHNWLVSPINAVWKVMEEMIHVP